MASWPDFNPARLLGALVAADVDFVVVGGLAVIAHGHIRTTNDVDITYDTDHANLEALGAVLLDLNARLRGVDEEVPFVADARTLRRTEILTLDTSAGWIDLLSSPPGAPPYPELRHDAERVEVGAASVRIASLEHLIAMKRASKRDKDRADLGPLEAIARMRKRSL